MFGKKSEEKKMPVPSGFSGSDLDLPPPPQMNFSSDLPALDLTSIADVPEAQSQDVPEFKPQMTWQSASVPAPPSRPVENLRPAVKQVQVQPQIALLPKPQEHVKIEKIEKDVHQIFEEKPVFIRSYKFRQIVEDLEELSGIPEAAPSVVKESKEREFDKWSACLEDIQRSLMLAEETLFEV